MTELQPSQMEISPDLTEAWVHFEHLSYSDFGRTGTLEHWKVTKMFEAARVFCNITGMFDFRSNISQNFGYFVFGMHYKMSPQLWNVRCGMSFPHKISQELQDIGTTSITVFSRLINKITNQELAECSCKLVYVNRATHRPFPQPEATVSKFSALIKEKKPLDLPKIAPEVPEAAFLYNVIVAPSNTDVNGHTNHSQCVCFCCDAAQMALRAGVVRGYENDISRYPLLEMEMVYSGESNTEDHLQVFIWQKENQLDCLSFVIKRPQKSENGKDRVIFYCNMMFGLEKMSTVARL